MLSVLSGCSMSKSVILFASSDMTYNKTNSYASSPFDQMMNSFASDANNYLKMSKIMMEEGDSLAELIMDTVAESTDADSLLNVSYSNMLEGDKMDRYQKSIEYANEALTVAKQNGELDMEKKIYRQLSDVYERLDNQEYAEYYKHKSEEIADSISHNPVSIVAIADKHWLYRFWWLPLLLFLTLSLLAIVFIHRHRRKSSVSDTVAPVENTIVLTSKTNSFAELRPESVVYLKSDKNYITIYYLDDSDSLTSVEMCQTMSYALSILENREHFFRCHRSYAVNMRYVSSWDENKVTLTCCDPLPASKSYVEKFSSSAQ